jgi:hypothetical protein
MIVLEEHTYTFRPSLKSLKVVAGDALLTNFPHGNRGWEKYAGYISACTDEAGKKYKFYITKELQGVPDGCTAQFRVTARGSLTPEWVSEQVR